MRATNGMLNSLTSNLINQRKSRVTLRILHSSAKLLILVPMLILIGGIGRCKNNFTATNSEGIIWVCFSNNPKSAFVNVGNRRSRRIRTMMLMGDMDNGIRRVRKTGEV